MQHATSVILNQHIVPLKLNQQPSERDCRRFLRVFPCLAPNKGPLKRPKRLSFVLSLKKGDCTPGPQGHHGTQI